MLYHVLLKKTLCGVNIQSDKYTDHSEITLSHSYFIVTLRKYHY